MEIKASINSEVKVKLENLAADWNSTVQDVCREIAEKFRVAAIARTPVGNPSWPDFDPHPGMLRRSWSEVKRAGGGYAFENTAEDEGVYYANIVESGGYGYLKGHRRTVWFEDGWYSSQAPGGILRWLMFREPEFMASIVNLVKDRLEAKVNI